MKRTILLVLFIAIFGIAGQAAAVSISFTPLNQTIGLGQHAGINVDLLVGPNESLEGFDLRIAFDPAILSLNSANVSALDGYLTMSTMNPPGNINLSGIGFDPASFLTGGIFTLACLDFTGTGLGTSPVNLLGDSNYLLAGAPDVTLFAPVNGSVQVQPVPEPGTFALIGLGLGGLFFWRRNTARS